VWEGFAAMTYIPRRSLIVSVIGVLVLGLIVYAVRDFTVGLTSTGLEPIHASAADLVFPLDAHGHTSKTVLLYADGNEWTLMLRYKGCPIVHGGAVTLVVFDANRHPLASPVTFRQSSGQPAYRIHDRGYFYIKLMPASGTGCTNWQLGLTSF